MSITAAHPASRRAFVALLGVLTLTAGCRSADRQGASAPPTPQAVQNPTAHLVAFLPMHEGYGPSDQDSYEEKIAPIAASHGMARTSALTVSKFLGGAGPAQASTIGVWALEAPASMKATMSDPRYAENMSLRDRIHDMPNAAMYMATEEFNAGPAKPGSTILVGLLAMNEGYGFDDHHDYETSISDITKRHGMHLIAEYRVLDKLSPSAPEAAAVNVWRLDSPESLGAVMRDPEYQTHIEHRDELHDMKTTTMWFTTER
ncbi:MAG: hypothetical protein KUG77_25805 [Nannocystaceae bacterium]|nr:hypothetical protein [Nannocystaceae bacterium]